MTRQGRLELELTLLVLQAFCDIVKEIRSQGQQKSTRRKARTLQSLN